MLGYSIRYSLNKDIDVDYIIPINELETVSNFVSTELNLYKNTSVPCGRPCLDEV